MQGLWPFKYPDETLFMTLVRLSGSNAASTAVIKSTPMYCWEAYTLLGFVQRSVIASVITLHYCSIIYTSRLKFEGK